MVHDAAARGFQRGAAVYVRARPLYHPALVERFVQRYGAGTVLELGAGTGIFTRPLAAAGVSVTAVEPVEAMRAELAAAVPAAGVLDGTAEAIPAGDGAVDTVVAAQAFHWFDHGRALDEIHRVLRAGGSLVTVWNVRDITMPWVAACSEIIERYAGDAPRHRDMTWRQAIDGDPRFEAVDDWSVPNPQRITVSGIVDRALSTSFIAALPDVEQRRVADEIGAVVTGLGHELDHPYTSELEAWAVRGPRSG